jgi:hypothetical protein
MLGYNISKRLNVLNLIDGNDYTRIMVVQNSKFAFELRSTRELDLDCICVFAIEF